MRSVVAVVAGYLVFGVSAAMLFKVTGQQPHEAATTAFIVGSTCYGAAFALLAGNVAARLAPSHSVLHAGIVAAVIAIGACVSFALRSPGSPVWSQLGALALMAPAALAGGVLAQRRS